MMLRLRKVDLQLKNGMKKKLQIQKKKLNHVLLRFPYFQPRMYLEATVSILTLHRTSSIANMSAMQ